jgi:hypothetical protein
MSAAGQAGGHVRRIQGQEFTPIGGWAGYEIPVHMPIKDAALNETLKGALWTLIIRLHPHETQPSVWFLMDNLHRDDAVLTLSRNARAWMPSQGIGLWPDQPPPRTMTSKDVLDLTWGETPQLPYHRVTRLRAATDVQHTAWTTMFGLGSTVLTLVPGGGQRLLDETREYLKRPIVDEGFQRFPFYFPLLGKKTLINTTAEELDGWLGPAQLYLRESEEDNAVLLLTRTAPSILNKALEETGFTVAPRDQPGEDEIL